MNPLSMSMTWIDEHETLIQCSGICVITKQPYSVVVEEKQLQNWIDGMLIQDAMPTMSAEDREWLMTGISPTGWDLMFEDGSPNGCDTLNE